MALTKFSKSTPMCAICPKGSLSLVDVPVDKLQDLPQEGCGVGCGADSVFQCTQACFSQISLLALCWRSLLRVDACVGVAIAFYCS